MSWVGVVVSFLTCSLIRERVLMSYEYIRSCKRELVSNWG